MLMVYNNLLSSLTFWALFFITIATALAPDMLLKGLENLGLKIKNVFPGNLEMGTLRRKTFIERPAEITTL
jgi:hypothetical protein